MIMSKIMFAWIGGHDFDAATGKEKGLGAIASAASTGNYPEIYLLNNYGPERDAEGYLKWLRGHCQSEIKLIMIPELTPIDFSAIYVVAKDHVGNVLKSYHQKVTPVFHLSPGTPAMASVWIMLAKGPFPEAELIQTAPGRGPEVVEMPFNIFTEFIPDVAKGADKQLIHLSEGLPPESPAFDEIIHKCSAMKTVVAQARLGAKRDVPVLIEGETGTGKELFARAIYNESPRSGKPFISVNCGTIPPDLFESQFFGHVSGAFTDAKKDHKGYFEQANGGILFLDEIGEMPLASQVKLLRVLNDGKLTRLGDKQEREVDVRIIGATNRNLMTEISEGRFREDLFYRLAVIVLKLPPLKERHGDLSLLLDEILKQVNKKLSSGKDYKQKKFSINAKNLMVSHDWPGNAREMFNTIMRICVWCQGKTINEEDVRQALLPPFKKKGDTILNRPLGEDFKLSEIHDFIDKHYIEMALQESGGVLKKASDLLGAGSYQNLINRMKKLGIER